MKRKKRDFVDYVYLSELDSVRTTTKEQIEGEKALFRTLVYDGKAVVLTYNQIVDSTTFLHCIRNKESFDILLKFFKDKRLLLNQYIKDMNLSKYIQENYNPDSSFKSSYFAFLNEYNEETKNIVLQGLIDSIRYGDSVYLENVMPEIVNQEHQNELYSYIKFILTINSYMYEYGCYVYSRPQEELAGHQMKDYMLKIAELLVKHDNNNSEIFKKIIDTHKQENLKDTRSLYYKIAEKLVSNENIHILKKYIDLAYNHALEYSIPIINRKDHLEEDLIKIISETTDNNYNLATVEKDWKDGYRITSITSYIFYKLKTLQWKHILFSCPFVEIFKILASLLLSFSIMIVINFFSGVEQLWISSSISILLTFIYSYCIDLITDKFVEKLPEWCATSAFAQFKNFFRDIKILVKRT